MTKKKCVIIYQSRHNSEEVDHDFYEKKIADKLEMTIKEVKDALNEIKSKSSVEFKKVKQ